MHLASKPLQLLHATKRPRAGTGVTRLRWSPGGQLLASASADGVILWDPATGSMLDQWSNTGYVGSIAWSPSGTSLAVGTVIFRRPKRVGLVRLWQFPQAESVAKSSKKPPLGAAGDPVSALAWSPDGTQLAAPIGWGDVIIYDPFAPQELAKYSSLAVVGPKDIAWSPDGSTIAALGFSRKDEAGNMLSVHIVSLYHVAGGESTLAIQESEYLTSIAWSPDSQRLLVTGANGYIALWDRASGQLAGTYAEQHGQIAAAAWSPDGSTIATINSDRAIHIWDAGTRQTQAILQVDAPYGRLESVAWSPDGQQLAVGTSERQIYIWSAP